MDRDTELDSIIRELKALYKKCEEAESILEDVANRAFILDCRIKIIENKQQAQADLGTEQMDGRAEAIRIVDIQKGAI